MILKAEILHRWQEYPHILIYILETMVPTVVLHLVLLTIPLWGQNSRMELLGCSSSLNEPSQAVLWTGREAHIWTQLCCRHLPNGSENSWSSACQDVDAIVQWPWSSPAHQVVQAQMDIPVTYVCSLFSVIGLSPFFSLMNFHPISYCPSWYHNLSSHTPPRMRPFFKKSQ